MKSLILSAFLAGAALFVEPAAAESNRLSQIDFDSSEAAASAVPVAPDGAEPPAIVDPEMLIRQGLVRNPSASAYTAEPAVAPIKVSAAPVELKSVPTDARGRLVADPIAFDSAQSPYTPPRLKGPFTDKDQPNTITTTAAWPRGTAPGCAEVNQPGQVCLKVKALKEVLFKFSGSDDFFDSQCAQRCGSGLIAVPTGLTVASVKGGSFKIASDSLQCHYQVQKDPQGRWLALQASKITCSCLPASCLQ